MFDPDLEGPSRGKIVHFGLRCRRSTISTTRSVPFRVHVDYDRHHHQLFDITNETNYAILHSKVSNAKVKQPSERITYAARTTAILTCMLEGIKECIYE